MRNLKQKNKLLFLIFCAVLFFLSEIRYPLILAGLGLKQSTEMKT